MKYKKIVFVQATLGHYHLPRMLTLTSCCQDAGFVLDNIELSGSMSAYPWFQTAEYKGFSNISLFPESQFETIHPKDLWLALKICLEKLNPDLVFLLGYSLSVMRKALNWCKIKKIPTVLISDSNRFDKKRYALLEFLKSLSVRRFDAAFVAGQSSSAYIQSLGMPKARVATGYDVVDVQSISNQAQCNRESINQIRENLNLPSKFFLFVGRLIPEKNVIRLLAAFEKFLQLNGSNGAWHLVICGSGPEQEKINNVLHNLPLEHQCKIHLYGHVEPKNIVDFFSVASFFILPSISESWGLVVNEAMACSLPVIVSNRAGSSFDLVLDGENGWIIDPFDIDGMAQVLNRAANMDEKMREEFGRKSRALINDWDLDRYCRGVIESSRMATDHAGKKFGG
jgi:glycosyltransferase involved in cell wall biosynthesis